MDIGRTHGVGGPERIEGPQKAARTTPPQVPGAPTLPGDKLEISSHAHLVSDALALPQVRLDRVEEVRRLIESGQFDTDQRLEGALDRFLEENPDLL